MNATDSIPTTQSAEPLQAETLERAFAQYQSELLGTLYYMVGNYEDARDAMQETFVKCWRNRHKLAEVRELKSWIFRIALNTARDLRQSAWKRRQKNSATEPLELTSDAPTPVVQMVDDEQKCRLQQAITHLRPEEQEVFLLKQNGDMTYDEIASALEIPSGTAKTRMRLAITKLREALQ